MIDTGDQLIKKSEVACRLRVHAGVVEAIVRDGGLTPIKFSPVTVRYEVDDLIRYVLEHKDERTPNEYGEKPHAEVEATIREAMRTRFPEGTQLMKYAETAQWLGVTKWTIANWADQGVLPRVRLLPSRSIRFDAFDVQELIARRKPSRVGVSVDEPLGRLGSV